MMKSWKTTLGGLLSGLGGLLLLLPETNSSATLLRHAGALLLALGTSITGLAARDNNKTSEDVGAKPQ